MTGSCSFTWRMTLLVGLLVVTYGCRGSSGPETSTPAPNGVHDHDHGHDHDHHHDHDHDHDHHHHGDSSHELPKTFPDAVARLETLTEAIIAACESGEPEKAHDELHEVGHLLSEWSKLVEQYQLEGAQATDAKGVGEAMFNRFMKLDDALHGGEEVDYDELAEGLKEDLVKLKAQVETPAE
jgi:hypothetical protein